jgi:hypothetical protein
MVRIRRCTGSEASCAIQGQCILCTVHQNYGWRQLCHAICHCSAGLHLFQTPVSGRALTGSHFHQGKLFQHATGEMRSMWASFRVCGMKVSALLCRVTHPICILVQAAGPMAAQSGAADRSLGLGAGVWTQSKQLDNWISACVATACAAPPCLSVPTVEQQSKVHNIQHHLAWWLLPIPMM